MLIGFRALQGAGAAIFPLSFGIIRDEFPAHKVGVAIGTISSVFGIGGGVGLVLSGVIVEHLSWHWLFLIGALPVFVATALIAKFVPESPVKTPAKPDYLGAAALRSASRRCCSRSARARSGAGPRRACSALAALAAAALDRLGRDRAPGRGPAGRPADAAAPRDGGDERLRRSCSASR